MSRNLNTFKSKFIDYAQEHLPKKSFNKFKPALDKAIQDLSSRDDDLFLEERKLDEETRIKEEHISSASYFRNDEPTNSLVLSVVGPNWKRGWRSISKDEYIYDLISWYFHFATQYVVRGRACEILGALALSYGETFNFTTSSRVTQTTLRSIDFPQSCIERTTKKSKEFKAWAKDINGLDPFVQRAIYFYIRFIELRNDGYFDEAITALDKVVEVFYQLTLDRKLQAKRDEFIKLHFKEDKLQEWANKIYEVRSFLGGHPSPSKWWDSEEIYGDWLDESAINLKVILRNMFSFEQKHRKVERYPTKWSNWFYENCSMIYDSVWFHKIPR